MHESNRKGLNFKNDGGVMAYNNEDSRLLEKTTNVDSEIADIFPALKKYKDEHNTVNLQKLMVEISEFCRAVYASTRNEGERAIYRSFVEKLNK